MASQNSPPKKPRLSLQIKSTQAFTSRPPRGFVSSRDPATFNTLSNVYATTIQRSAQSNTGEPLTAINTLQQFSITSPLEEQPDGYKGISHRVVTPYVANYPETPLSATCASPQKMEILFPSVMTATPPLSAGPVESTGSSRAFSFADTEVKGLQGSVAPASPVESRTSRGRLPPTLSPDALPPYSHPRSLHSILRNSPLPPRTAIPPPSPRRQSLRLAEKAAKRVEYNNPLTQEIVTNKYIKSHIDLLCEDGSPLTPSSTSPGDKQSDVLDVALKFAPNEIQDGGQTPGPYEDMRRRMAGLPSGTPASSSPSVSSPAGPAGIRKRKKKEKKRQWRWTIGQENEDGEDNISGAEAAVRASMRVKSEDNLPTPQAILPRITSQQFPDVPTPTIEGTDSADGSVDVMMSDAEVSSRATTVEGEALDVDMEATTPTGPKAPPGSTDLASHRMLKGDTPIPELALKGDTPIPELAAKRDTPVPPEYAPHDD
ncbi:proteinrelated to glucan 1, 4-alpha-glucosidase [Sarocladium implicatum]|nr:proteinrelated to glucan 1, 4-alpha-glucosidase [Sarocladium implicatum]